MKFDQRVRDYHEPRYILDTGGHVGGVRGISVYMVNDNMYFQVISSPDEDTMIWKVCGILYYKNYSKFIVIIIKI